MAKSIEGGVVVVNTLSTKNNGDYPLVMAESVQMENGENLENKIADLELSGGGISNYNDLNNKPQINGVELNGNKTSSDLKIGEPTQEQVSTAVDNYLSKNPIKPYELPVMTETKLGGAKAIAKTTESVPVAVDENGQLYVPEREAIPNITVVDHGTSDTTFALTANIYHKWGEVASLNLTLAEGEEGVANIYWFSFTSGSTATHLTLPETIVTDLIVQPNTYYEISIVDNHMVYADWSVSA